MDTPYYCTPQALAELVAELDQLRGPVRAELVERFADAQGEETELEENTGYQQALVEMAALEQRIAMIADLISRAVVQEPTGDEVTAGCWVVVSVRGPGDKRARRETFVIDSALRHDVPDDVTLVSSTSPMGRALVGRRPGEQVHWSAPVGEFTGKVVEILPPGS